MTGDRVAKLALLGPSFFGNGNKLDWKVIQGGALDEKTRKALSPWLEDLRSGTGPFVLPFAREQGVIWYGMAFDGQAFRLLREELLAFIGPSYSHFDGKPLQGWVEAPIESLLMEWFEGNVLRIEVPERHRHTVRDRLLLWRRLRLNRPRRMAAVARPTGRVLRDFEEALRMGHSLLAEESLSELRGQKRLSPQNLAYLEILLAESTEDWNRIFSDVGKLLNLRRPKRVTRALLRAIYNLRIVAHQRHNDPRAALQEFLQSVEPQFRSLLATRVGLSCLEVDALFMLQAMSHTPVNEHLRDEILNQASKTYYAEWLNSIANVNTKVVPPHIAEPSELFMMGDFDGAWRIALGKEASYERTVLLLRCANEIRSFEMVRVALAAIDAAEADIRGLIEGHQYLSQLLAALRSFEAPASDGAAQEFSRVPEGWLDWLRLLARQEPWPHAVEAAENGSEEWLVDDLLVGGPVADEAADLLLEVEVNKDRLRDALPYFLAALNRPKRAISSGNLLLALTLVVSSEESPGRTGFLTLNELLELRLSQVISADDYVGLLDMLGSTINRWGAPIHFDSMTETLELLAQHSCPNKAAREQLGHLTGSLMAAFPTRLTKWHLRNLNKLLSEVGCEMPPNLITQLKSLDHTAEPDLLREAFEKTSFALYSLKESVLQRVAGLLKEVGASVQTFCDKAGGSPSLKAAAEGVDVFVVATAAATHAATGFIQSCRPSNRVILRPAGQGSASMISCLTQYAETLRSELG